MGCQNVDKSRSRDMRLDMNSIQVIRLAIDGGLLLSLLVFAYRFLRSQSPAFNKYELQSLNASLKTAVKEADEASRSLNEQLRQRKDGLEKLLFEIQGAESRINKIVSNSEQNKSELEGLIQAAQVTIKRATEVSKKIESVDKLSNRIRQERYEETEMLEPPAPSFADSFRAEPIKSKIEVKQSKATENIYGEKIAQAQSAQVSRPIPQTYRKLNQNIEVEVKPNEEIATEEIKTGLEDIYAAAEELLKAGKSLEFVASTTKLPEDEVRLLARIISQDSPKIIEEEVVDEPEIPVRSSRDDTRLGVLGQIRRQTQLV
jgi:hypothetical protein